METTGEQERWNEFGRKRATAIENDPSRFLIGGDKFPLTYRLGSQEYSDFMSSLGPLEGKKVIDLGCGRGELAVFLAKRGAKVTAIDVGIHLIFAARALARVNNVDCNFSDGSITNLPLKPNNYDIVIGLAILHHLSRSDVVKALEETHRVLKDDGVAVFYEPIENSKVFNFVQNLFPVGKGTPYYRPSIVQRRSWAKYLAALDDRPLTNQELILAGAKFRTVKIEPYGFLIRLERLMGKKFSNTLMAVDNVLLKISPLKQLCRFALIAYRK
jgi:2-polyprenyl-3-methyl-5-hydroxy-6-metoxy-1,4-benzoquinol methylase